MRAYQPVAAAVSFGLLVPLGACANGVEASSDAEADALALSSLNAYPHRDVCSAPGPGEAHCHAKVRTDASGNVATSSAPQGQGPSALQSAYAIPAGGGQGLTVAVIDAYDDPTAESDLATYRSTYGLPACTTANGCFKKINETGQQANYPAANTNWSQEITLDLDMVSALCPSCKIVLVEASSQSLSDLGASVNLAASLGVAAISNSYGGAEASGESSLASEYYNHPGIAVTASSGDSGYGVEFPAAGAPVIAVGGTTLTRSSSSRGWAEAAWSDGGSGCSRYVTKPSWQTDTGCANRTVVDVAAEADPNTGVAGYYDGNWYIFGGTSAASALVAAALTASGHAGSGAAFLYAHPSDLYDVTTGSNGSCGTYLCTAQVGYDGPTGLGTINGAALAAAASSGSSASASSSAASASASSTTASSSSSRSSIASQSSASSSSSSSSPGSSSSSSSGSMADAGSDAGRIATVSLTASLVINETWSNAYCATVTIANIGAVSVSTWTLGLDTNQASVVDVANATFAGAAPSYTVTPPAATASIAAGSSNAFEYCALVSGSHWEPAMTSLSGE